MRLFRILCKSTALLKKIRNKSFVCFECVFCIFICVFLALLFTVALVLFSSMSLQSTCETAIFSTNHSKLRTFSSLRQNASNLPKM